MWLALLRKNIIIFIFKALKSHQQPYTLPVEQFERVRGTTKQWTNYDRRSERTSFEFTRTMIHDTKLATVNVKAYTNVRFFAFVRLSRASS